MGSHGDRSGDLRESHCGSKNIQRGAASKFSSKKLEKIMKMKVTERQRLKVRFYRGKTNIFLRVLYTVHCLDVVQEVSIKVCHI